MTQAQQEVTARKMETTRNISVRTPATDIYETEAGIVVVADMPGVTEKGLEVTLENSVLTLVGRSDTTNRRGASPCIASSVRQSTAGPSRWPRISTARRSRPGSRPGRCVSPCPRQPRPSHGASRWRQIHKPAMTVGPATLGPPT